MKIHPTCKIIFTIALALGIALFTYFLLIHFLVDPSQISPDLPRGANLFNFYEMKHDGDIFILGSSSVNEGVDAHIADDYLQKNHNNRSVYVLGIDSDTPIQRVFETNNIIASRPKMVVIGLSYRDLTNETNTTNIDRERLLIFIQGDETNEDKKIREEFLPYLNDDQFTFVPQSSLDRFFDDRKFVLPRITRLVQRFFVNHDDQNERRILKPTNFKDPWIIAVNKTEAEKTEIVKALSKNYSENVYPVFSDQNPRKKALLFMINRLRQENIGVIIINLPINPLLSDVINATTRKNFSEFLNSTGVPWYDFEQEYPSAYFTDTGHMNSAGRDHFSSQLAKLIASNIMKGE
jgi:hypothetical protein